jgi:hypothetical protein
MPGAMNSIRPYFGRSWAYWIRRLGPLYSLNSLSRSKFSDECDFRHQFVSELVGDSRLSKAD